MGGFETMTAAEFRARTAGRKGADGKARRMSDPALYMAWLKVSGSKAGAKHGDIIKAGDADLFLAYLAETLTPPPVREWQFCKGRLWRADYAWPDAGLILEVQGGHFIGKGHSKGARAREDYEKQNAAVRLGLRVLKYQCDLLIRPETIAEIRQVLALEPVTIERHPKSLKR